MGSALAGMLVVVAAWIGRSYWVLGRSYADVQKPIIVADHSAQAVARGKMLFETLCIECHGGNDGRATGRVLDEVPAFLGTFYSANLAHPETGVHRRSDAEIARVLRYGVLADGRFSPAMSAFGKLGDADVAALLGFIRTQPPQLAPGGQVQPRTQLSVVGTLLIASVGGVNVDGPAVGVPTPVKEASVEYGRYMANVLDCAGCHTAGFGSAKMDDPEAFAGGFELTDPTGTKIWSKNITPDEETGIGRFSVDDFADAITRGVTPDGYLVRKPMPLFSGLDRIDAEALYLFLRTVDKVKRQNRPGGHPLERAHSGDPPETLFVNLGCAACHGEGGPYRGEIVGALDKSDDDVAAWIRDPQSIKPGTKMPAFGHALDVEQARALARFVKELARQRGS